MIIVDTGFWVALANKNDNYHETVKNIFAKYNEPLITTWCVVTETCYFLQSRRGVEAVITFINAMSQGSFVDKTNNKCLY
ncbi:type II toxin-antitoxin system VapC family toxin [Okeania sp. SIO3B5]|uniref:type II toxin-antitoxin system VapC family toxin n=1 Tax=Okeania sp. SIO3B5 TaxID=2607811 RepID=UPI0025CE38F6|nr:PIN domain-containing protein [Okeania sp. SIO3B5]